MIRPLVMDERYKMKAKELAILLELDCVSSRDVILWADAVIEIEDSPPYELIELSLLNPEKKQDFLRYLNQFSTYAFDERAVRTALFQIADTLDFSFDFANRIAFLLYHYCLQHSADIPDDMNSLLVWDDTFYLTNEGVYDHDPKKLTEDFQNDLLKMGSVTI